MKFYSIFLCFVFFPISIISWGQVDWGESKYPIDTININKHKYREDQMYLGVSLNFLSSLPEDITQNSLSYGIQLGIIRDFPLNKKCNKAIGIGLGYALNTFDSNLLAIESNKTIYLPAPDGSNKNIIITNELQIPLEFRIRSSTHTNKIFPRLYIGLLNSIVIKTFLINNDNSLPPFKSNINPIQQSVYVTLSLKTSWSFYISYRFSNLFMNNTAYLPNNSTNLTNLNINFLEAGIRLFFL